MTAGDDRYPDGSAVETRYPLTPEQEAGPRDAWPWLSGTVLSRCGPDEWLVRVDGPRAGHARTHIRGCRMR